MQSRVLRVASGGFVLVAALAIGGRAAACACCAEPFERGSDARESSDHEREQLARLAFTGEIGLGESGQREPEFELPRQSVSGRFESGALQLSVRSPDGRAAELSFLFRPVVEAFSADLRLVLPPADYARLMGEAPHETRLYKELRLRGKLANQGPIFGPESSVAGEAELVLYGTGNNCFDAGDFHGWTLDFALERAGETEPALARGGLSAAAAPAH
jgi:hypothetical protein